jgi:hypothetical protein
MKDQPIGAYGPAVQKVLQESDCREALERVRQTIDSFAMYGGSLVLMDHYRREGYRIADDKAVTPLINENGPFR